MKLLQDLLEIGENLAAQLDEVSPPGFGGTVKAMKKHKNISNPFALAWYMKKKGAKSHIKEAQDVLSPDEHSKAAKEFEEANARYKKAYPKGFASDHAVLKKTLTLFKAKKFKDAANAIDRADTLVREIVPEKAWKIIHREAK